MPHLPARWNGISHLIKRLFKELKRLPPAAGLRCRPPVNAHPARAGLRFPDRPDALPFNLIWGFETTSKLNAERGIGIRNADFFFTTDPPASPERLAMAGRDREEHRAKSHILLRVFSPPTAIF